MPACRCPRNLGRRPRAGGCDGFTLLEVMVSMAIISTVMLALAPMFVTTMRVNHQQSDRQAAIQAADDAMERARAIQVSALLTNRDQVSSIAQAGAAPAAVKVLLTGDPNAAAVLPEDLAWDTTAASGAGTTAALPTIANPLTLSGVQYQQQWFIGKCGRAVGVGNAPCQAGQTGAGYTPLFRIVVAVGWTDRLCPADGCTYVTTSLVSSTTEEPVFSIRDSIQRVKITSVTPAQLGEVSAPLSLPFTASGSNVTWKVSGQPAGLNMNPVTGVISGTPNTATAAAGVTTQVTATDANSQEDYVSFTWVINAVPIVTAPGNQSIAGGATYTKPFLVTKGTAPYTWSWSAGPSPTWSTGTPPGLTLDPITGIASGIANVVGSNNLVAGVTTGVTVSVTDKFGVVGTKTFNFVVGPVLSVGTFTVPTTTKGVAIAPVTVTAVGGVPPYVSWTCPNAAPLSLVGLPPGLTITANAGTATATISGTPTTTTAKTYTTVTITVTDSSADATARSATRAPFSWRVL